MRSKEQIVNLQMGLLRKIFPMALLPIRYQRRWYFSRKSIAFERCSRPGSEMPSLRFTVFDRVVAYRVVVKINHVF